MHAARRTSQVCPIRRASCRGPAAPIDAPVVLRTRTGSFCSKRSTRLGTPLTLSGPPIAPRSRARPRIHPRALPPLMDRSTAWLYALKPNTQHANARTLSNAPHGTLPRLWHCVYTLTRVLLRSADPLVPNLLVLPPGHNLHGHALVKQGNNSSHSSHSLRPCRCKRTRARRDAHTRAYARKVRDRSHRARSCLAGALILQDRASCLSALALNPRTGGPSLTRIADGRNGADWL